MHSCSIIPPWIICDTRLIWTLNLWDRGIKGYNLKVLSFIMLEQQSGNNSPKAKATRFYKVLLACTHTCARMYCLWILSINKSRVVVIITAHKSSNIYYLALEGKNLPTPILDEQIALPLSFQVSLLLNVINEL